MTALSTVILQFICPDRAGLVSRLSGWVAENGGNIRHADHHTDYGAGIFLSRIEWDLEGFQLSKKAIFESVSFLARQLDGKAKLNFSDEIPQVAIMVSKQSHCLIDLLWRVHSGELRMNIPMVISNHPDLESMCNDFQVPFKSIPLENANKLIAEKLILEFLEEYKVDTLVLAKYMQILSGNFLRKFSTVINIHHSFLPAFKGAHPYQRAWNRGVKLIGATAHYVTEDLDDGPIIEQTITQISHRDEVDDLIRKGRDMERMALARALRLHLHRQVMVYQGRTAVFA